MVETIPIMLDKKDVDEKQNIGKYWPESNKTWRLANCLENMIKGKYGYDSDEAQLGGSDWVECTSYTVLTISSIITLVLISILIAFQLK